MPDILTKREVEGDVEDLDAWHMNACHTIEAMAELLSELRQHWGVGDWSYSSDPKFFDALDSKVDALLATYHGTKGGDDDGK